MRVRKRYVLTAPNFQARFNTTFTLSSHILLFPFAVSQYIAVLKYHFKGLVWLPKKDTTY